MKTGVGGEGEPVLERERGLGAEWDPEFLVRVPPSSCVPVTFEPGSGRRGKPSVLSFFPHPLPPGERRQFCTRLSGANKAPRPDGALIAAPESGVGCNGWFRVGSSRSLEMRRGHARCEGTVVIEGERRL